MTTEKRLLVAAALSLGVLLLWAKLFPEPARPAPPRPAPATPAAAAGSSPGASEGRPGQTQAPEGRAAVAPAAALEESLATVENGFVRATFTNRGAVLTSLVLVKYKDAEGRPLELGRKLPPEAPRPLSLDFGAKADLTDRLGRALFVIERPGPTALVLRYADAAVIQTTSVAMPGATLSTNCVAALAMR